MSARSGRPAFLQVADDLRAKIKSGALPVDAQLPSMAQLREMYGVSNTVVRDALNELRHAGLVIGQQGKGVFVRSSEGAEGIDAGINRRLDELAAAVRSLDERMTRLEQSGD